jgi:hypothetical protein
MAVIKKETARIEVLDAHGSKLQVVEYQDFHSTLTWTARVMSVQD